MRILPFMKPKKGVTLAGVDYNDDSGGGGGGYTLPTATSSRLGGIKVGNGLTVESDGTLSASDGGGGGLFDFSTTEFATGQKWIDGKDIYGIVIHIDNPTFSSSYQHTESNPIVGYDSIVDYNSIVKVDNGRFWNTYYSTSTQYFWVDITTNTIYFNLRGAGNPKYIETIIYYTKPTA